MLIEVDPREIEPEMIGRLHAEGFNRLSMGVQDFNKAVQERVNRIQEEENIFVLDSAHVRARRPCH